MSASPVGCRQAELFPLQKTPAPNLKTRVVAFFIGTKIHYWHNTMFIKDKSMWHATCLILRVVKRSMRVQVASFFDLFHDRPVGIASMIVKEVDIPGLGNVHVVSSVDCLGAMCPRPQLLTMKVLSEVEPGAVVEVVLDNPTAVEGFPALAQTLGCTHLATLRKSGCWHVYLRKSF
jgi:tRNA 2-thiouridine synthesizing protein A